MVVLRRPGTILAALRPEPKADRPLLGGFWFKSGGPRQDPQKALAICMAVLSKDSFLFHLLELGVFNDQNARMPHGA